MKTFMHRTGPGPMIAAAFIGPGTVTVCTLAGAQYGTVLLWALLFSTLATAVLQEAAARLGLITQRGLARNIKEAIAPRGWRWLALGIVLSAVVGGAIAFESGNIRGGSLGILTLLEKDPASTSIAINSGAVLAIAGLASALLWQGRIATLERALLAMVALMSCAFMFTALMVVESWQQVLGDLFIPSLPPGSSVIVVALIGTTIVPYNLFLHSELVQQKWSNEADLSYARADAVYSVLFGGLVSMSIVVCAAALPNAQISSAADLAQGLAPVFGDTARSLLAVGLIAAGLTSAITAPLAATVVIKGVFGWQGDLRSPAQRLTWMTVLGAGTFFALLQINAIELIKFAQFANGLVLPFAVAFLIFAVNQHKVMNGHVNTRMQNALAGFVLLIVTMLGMRGVLAALGI